MTAPFFAGAKAMRAVRRAGQILIRGQDRKEKETKMRSYLIKDTTLQERLEIVRTWEEAEGCENSGMDLTEFYSDYISGRREIAEINAAFRTAYVVETPEDDGKGCGMGIRR